MSCLDDEGALPALLVGGCPNALSEGEALLAAELDWSVVGTLAIVPSKDRREVLIGARALGDVTAARPVLQ